MNSPLAALKAYVTPVESTSPKMNNFNIIRFFAAFMVIYGHMSSIMGVAAFPLLNQRVSTIGVKIFFIISGYLITKSYLSDTHFGRYMIRRSFRIFPALIVLVLLTVFVLGPVTTSLPLGEYFASGATWRYLKNLILSPVYALPGVFTDCAYPNAVNGSLWTLPIEFSMYLILPLLVILFKKLGSIKWGMAVCAVVALVFSLLYNTVFASWRLVLYGTNLPDALPLLPYFFVGSFFSFPETKKYLNFQLSVVLIILAAFVSGGVVITELAVFFALPYFILSFALTEKPAFSKWFEKSDFSYGLYLYGFPIQQLLWSYLFKTGIAPLPMALIAFASTLLLAIPSWYLIEKPSQKLAQRLLAKWKNRRQDSKETPAKT